MKIQCALPIDVELDLGHLRRPGETNSTALMRLLRECPHKDIRPCAKWQGWVIKEETCVGCKYCLKVIGKKSS